MKNLLKAKLTPEVIGAMIDNHPSRFHQDGVDFFSFIAEIELLIMEVSYAAANHHKTHAAESLQLNRTTFVEKWKKYKGE